MRQHYLQKSNRWVRLLTRIFSLILLIFIAMILFIWLLNGSPPAPPWSSLFVVAFCVFVLTFDRLLGRYAMVGFAKRPDANIEIEWEFSRERIITRSGLGTADVSWQSFLRVVETNDGFLLYPLQNLFHWIPLTAFASPDCIVQLRELVREHGIVFADKRSRKPD